MILTEVKTLLDIVDIDEFLTVTWCVSDLDALYEIAEDAVGIRNVVVPTPKSPNIPVVV